MEVEVRNAFSLGDALELMRAKGDFLNWSPTTIVTTDGERVDRAKTPKTIVTVNLPGPCEAGDMLRRKKC